CTTLRREYFDVW
nr:immunoglobulin heavy chain junction region [Mus musculus]MBK4198089.1 immunoglobulin heavy chain junction region [Mus musculus]